MPKDKTLIDWMFSASLPGENSGLSSIVDEGDNFLIELALAGNAAHIVTNNIGDLQNAELNFPGLTIVKPEKLLRGE